MNKKQNVDGSVNSAGFFSIRELYKSLTLKFYLSPQKRLLGGFSLMEMMIVLLIVAIIAAATAPMVSKKLARNAGTADSPWVFTGLSDNVAFNQGGNNNTTAIIGAQNVPNNLHPRLYINSDGNNPHLSFGTNNANVVSLIANAANGNIGISNATIPNGTVAFGSGQTIANGATNSVAIGAVTANAANTVAIGRSVQATGAQSIAIGVGDGQNANATGTSTIAIGNDARATSNNAVAVGNTAIVNGSATDSIALGHSATVSSPNSTAIGSQAAASGNHAIAIGDAGENIFNGNGYDKNTAATADYAIAIGSTANARGERSIAIGPATPQGPGFIIPTISSATRSIAIGAGPAASANDSIAIGSVAYATGTNSVAIGNSAFATNANSVAIGTNASSTADNQIVLGRKSSTVYIPGNLVVMGSTLLGGNGTSRVYVNVSDGSGNGIVRLQSGPENNYIRANSGYNGQDIKGGITATGVSIGKTQLKHGDGTLWFTSDSRLKNVGEKFTGGLEELKKLDLYHYTFKKDEKKTPQVGVMAQDLRKVFPNAVWEGEDGYLKIRWDEMFYAVINAVKELDSKISTAFEQIKANTDKVAKLQTKIDEQQKVIDELKAQNTEFEKRLKKLEQAK